MTVAFPRFAQLSGRAGQLDLIGNGMTNRESPCGWDKRYVRVEPLDDAMQPIGQVHFRLCDPEEKLATPKRADHRKWGWTLVTLLVNLVLSMTLHVTRTNSGRGRPLIQ